MKLTRTLTLRHQRSGYFVSFVIAECDYFVEINGLISVYINILFGNSEEILGQRIIKYFQLQNMNAKLHIYWLQHLQRMKHYNTQTAHEEVEVMKDQRRDGRNRFRGRNSPVASKLYSW